MAVLPFAPLNSAASNARLMAPCVASSAWAHTPDGAAPSGTSRTSAPEDGKAGRANVTVSISRELPRERMEDTSRARSYQGLPFRSAAIRIMQRA